MWRPVVKALGRFLGVLVFAGLCSPSYAEPANCLGAPYIDAKTALQADIQNTVLELRAALEDFPMLMAVLDDQKPQICLSDELSVEKAYFEVESGRIMLAGDMPKDLMLVILVHELRHVDQMARGICPSDKLSMKDYARGVLALEADASVASILVAWARKEAGNDALWGALERWSMTADIAARFGEAMAMGEDVARAASVAFDQWYAMEARREQYYVASCSAYLDRQDHAHALPGNLPLSADFLDRLCVLPDGRDYSCSDQARGAR